MAIIVTLIVALIAGGIAQVLVADLEMGRLVRWDTEAQYLAQAGLEHQIYLLKADKTAPAVPYTNYPATPDQRTWYVTSRRCLLPTLDDCTSNVSTRRWCILSTGEIRRYNPDATFTVLHTRTIRAEVDIAYGGTLPLYGTPLAVAVLRWDEDLRASPTCP
jgi:Tfp pilus assembly protein PilX